MIIVFIYVLDYLLKNTFNLMKDKIFAQNKKIINLRKLFGVFKFDVKNTLINLSNIVLTNEESNLLKFGPKFSIRKRIDKFKLQSSIESLYGYYFTKYDQNMI